MADSASDMNIAMNCPLPIADYPSVLLAHGGGGRLMHQLIESVFLPALGGAVGEHDGAVLEAGGARLAFTTDSYVVQPLFFPGGDIGVLAVHGTINDLAMCGARPLALSVGCIIEEGLPMDTLRRVARSLGEAAAAAGVPIVTGDTKVVDRGKGDGLFLNTAGIGLIEHGLTINPRSVREGDVILINGDLGRHGVAIMGAREGLAFDSAIESDTAALHGAVAALLEAGIAVHCLRDLTRGGLASTLVEIAEARGAHITLDERAIPVREDVAAVCELLGLDPLYVANEGRFAAFVAPEDADRALEILRARPEGAGACRIGRVTGVSRGLVTMTSRIGASRVIDMLSGEQLPRIC